MRPYKERDILEYFPLALYSMAMIVKSGGSLEKAFSFVATKDFGRVSLLCIDVLEIALDDTFLAGLESIRYASDNRFYQEALMVMIQYAKHGADIGDRLVGLGRRMETSAVMEKRNHYIRVREALIPKTVMMLGGIGFLFIVIVLVLTRDWPMQEGGPILQMKDVEPMLLIWLVVLGFIYPFLFRSYILINPAFVMPRLKELMHMFGNQYDMAVSQFLSNTAAFIEMGWSLEQAADNAINQQQSTATHLEAGWANQARMSLSDHSQTFDSTLLSLGLIANSRKYDLTAHFLNEARDSRYASMAETLKLLSDTFWSSHMTTQHYQVELLVPVVGSFALKFAFIFILAFMFPLFGPFLVLMLCLDSALLLLCMV